MIIQLLFSATNSAFVKKDGEELNRKETYLHKWQDRGADRQSKPSANRCCGENSE